MVNLLLILMLSLDVIQTYTNDLGIILYILLDETFAKF